MNIHIMINNLWKKCKTPISKPSSDNFTNALQSMLKKSCSLCSFTPKPQTIKLVSCTCINIKHPPESQETPNTKNQSSDSITKTLNAQEETKQDTDDYFLQLIKAQVQLANKIDVELLENEIKNRKISLLEVPTRKVIIFDLDETLILNTENGVILRPYLDILLENLSLLFDLWVWSASDVHYVRKIVSLLDPYGIYITKLLDVSYCIEIGGMLVKDIRIFSNADVDNMALVDNYLFSFIGSINNGVLVQSFNGCMEDCELKQLCEFLVHIASYYTMKEALKENLNLSSYFI